MDGTATEQLSMTAAELSFVLASGDRPGETPRLLGLTDADRRVVTRDGTETTAEDFDAAAAVMRDELGRMLSMAPAKS
ncbi:hypothetical protein [Dactylosporangium sp. NPDC048998]|uniref:hypothetical protein n=1 Tax=Dactylosporangium sp. NPDC048998 TaxID=3363976 RepID=UPI00371A5197